MKLTGNQCECTACGKVFKSEFAFNKHRTGEHGKDRRCKDDNEMVAAGMATNARGVWVSALRIMEA